MLTPIYELQFCSDFLIILQLQFVQFYKYNFGLIGYPDKGTKKFGSFIVFKFYRNLFLRLKSIEIKLEKTKVSLIFNRCAKHD